MLVRLRGDGSEYNAMLEKGERATEEFGHRTEELTREVEEREHRVKEFAESVTLALEALGVERFLHHALEGFNAMEGGLIRLRGALQGNVKDIEETTEAYTKFAKEVAHESTVGVAEVRGLLARTAAFGLYGDAAQVAVKNAVDLATATNSNAETLIRFTAGMQKGIQPFDELLLRYKRLIPQLREAKTEEEGMAIVNRLLAQGSRTNAELAESTAGKVQHLEHAWHGFKSELGGFVATAIKPTVEWLHKGVQILSGMDEELKRNIVRVAMAGVAFLALRPTLSVLQYAVGPLIQSLKLIPLALGALVSPVGIVVAAVAGAAAAWALWTDSGQEAVSSAKAFWVNIGQDAAIGIKGVKDAISSGDFALAFEIAWTQVKLTFAKATRSIREGWVATVFLMREGWVEMTFFLTKTWVQFVEGWRKSGAVVRELWRDLVGSITGKGHNLTDIVDDWAKATNDARRGIKEAEEQRRIGQENANKAAMAGMQEIEDRLKELEAKRNALAAQAAAKAGEHAKNEFNRAIPSKKDVVVAVKVDAAAFKSAEALARISHFQDIVVAATTRTTSSEAGAAAAEGLDVAKEQRDLLRDIKDKLPDEGLAAAGVA